MKHLSKEIDKKVVNLLKNGLTYREIALNLSISLGTVHNIAKKFNCARYNLKGGRPKKLSENTKRSIIRKITSGKWDNAVEASKNLKNDANIDVCPQTIRNVLKSMGLRSRYKVKKPMISLKNRKERMEFAKSHKDWTLEDWHRVVWSDESKINRIASNGRHWCWKRQSEKLNSRTIQPTLKFGGGSVMVWGCITSKGVGQLTKINGTLDADLYCDILNDELQNTLDFYGLKKSEIIFQQDNDPKHTAIKSKKCIADLILTILE